jgi:D-3-phosphoglycerate dehydrogenase
VRILVVEPIASEGIERLRAVHEVDERPGISRDELCAILPGYDALVVRSQVQVDAAVIAAAGNRLQVVGRAGVGVDNVDLEAATAAGITVVNAPTGNTIAAAEHTLALLYGVARKIAAADASVRRGEWKRAQFTGLELRGRTLGIVGLGKIGQAIAVRAVAMEMVVLASDPYVSEEQAAHFGVELVPFDRLVEQSDVITVHVPLTRTTRGLIGRDQIARMKRGAILLNVARGGILDEGAVAEALAEGQLAGAGVDVFDAEPPVGSPLLDAPNTLLTPHLGASTAEAQVLVAEEVADQVLDVLAGRSARYAVNAPLLTPETARAIAPYLPLAEMLGRFFAQFARSGVRTVTLEIAGELAAFDASPLTAAVLRGMIETSTTQRVNLVNAAALAKARGITVVERKTPDAGSYAAQISLSGESGGRITTVAGTIAGGELRLTRLDDYRLDLEPTEVMLITHHRDRPGMIGRIGQTLGEADVNISAMHVGRSAPRADALMILALDDDVAPEVAEAIRNHDSVIELWTIASGGPAGRGRAGRSCGRARRRATSAAWRRPVADSGVSSWPWNRRWAISSDSPWRTSTSVASRSTGMSSASGSGLADAASADAA